jgi:hypothetical protein
LIGPHFDPYYGDAVFNPFEPCKRSDLSDGAIRQETKAQIWIRRWPGVVSERASDWASHADICCHRDGFCAIFGTRPRHWNRNAVASMVSTDSSREEGVDYRYCVARWMSPRLAALPGPVPRGIPLRTAVSPIYKSIRRNK